MAKSRRTSFAWVTGLLLLAGTIGIPAWLLNRGSSATKPVHTTDSLDVVCNGRVDAKDMVIALEPPPPGGRVVGVHVAEGAEVKKDQPLISIDDRAAAEGVKDAKAAVAAAELEYELAKLKFDSYPKQIESLQKKIDAAAATVKGAEEKLKQLKTQVGVGGMVPVTEADIASAQAQIDSLRLNIDAETINIDSMRKYQPKLELDGSKLRLDRAKEILETAKATQALYVVKAPSDGTIIRLQTALGQTLVTGSPLDPAIVFAPAGPLIVRAEVEQADLGRVKVGMSAILKDDSRRETLTLTGKVIDIARWIAPKKRMLMDPGDFNDVRTSEVLVALDPTKDRLWLGQKMVVRFVNSPNPVVETPVTP